jgi:ribosomal protein S27E
MKTTARLAVVQMRPRKMNTNSSPNSAPTVRPATSEPSRMASGTPRSRATRSTTGRAHSERNAPWVSAGISGSASLTATWLRPQLRHRTIMSAVATASRGRAGEECTAPSPCAARRMITIGGGEDFEHASASFSRTKIRPDAGFYTKCAGCRNHRHLLTNPAKMNVAAQHCGRQVDQPTGCVRTRSYKMEDMMRRSPVPTAPATASRRDDDRR